MTIPNPSAAAAAFPSHPHTKYSAKDPVSMVAGIRSTTPPTMRRERTSGPRQRRATASQHSMCQRRALAILLGTVASSLTSVPSGATAFAPAHRSLRRQNPSRVDPRFAYVDRSDATASSPPELPRASFPEQRRSDQDADPSKSAVHVKHPPTHLPNGGRVTLVGSGPGDPDLLTVAAHKIITDPDNLVISDRLVSQEILDLIEGEVRIANKTPGCQHKAQAEIYDWVQEGLDAGRHVVRLKIGDPFVFGRGGEEVLHFRSNYGVESKVVPGVSAAFSAPLLGAIPVTHRGVSNQVVMCTGYGKENTSPDLIRYHPEQTVVFLMAVGRLRELSERLQELAGYPADTPVAIIERAGCPEQRTVVGRMDNIADVAEEHEVKPPSTIVVGNVVRVLLDEVATDGEEVFAGLVQEVAAASSTL